MHNVRLTCGPVLMHLVPGHMLSDKRLSLMSDTCREGGTRENNERFLPGETSPPLRVTTLARVTISALHPLPHVTPPNCPPPSSTRRIRYDMSKPLDIKLMPVITVYHLRVCHPDRRLTGPSILQSRISLSKSFLLLVLLARIYLRGEQLLGSIYIRPQFNSLISRFPSITLFHSVHSFILDSLHPVNPQSC
jgi:hypothetical protein